jgi:hypothetical protein
MEAQLNHNAPRRWFAPRRDANHGSLERKATQWLNLQYPLKANEIQAETALKLVKKARNRSKTAPFEGPFGQFSGV